MTQETAAHATRNAMRFRNAKRIALKALGRCFSPDDTLPDDIHFAPWKTNAASKDDHMIYCLLTFYVGRIDESENMEAYNASFSVPYDFLELAKNPEEIFTFQIKEAVNRFTDALDKRNGQKGLTKRM